jgi:soluble lytic murein transglycosylase
MVSETPEVVLKMAEELSARGHIVPACSLAFPYLVDHPYAALGVWGLGYPAAYADQLNLRARQYGVEPELVWAVMRQETLFQAELVSHAGARGLMQIMGELQSDTCKEIGVGCVPGDAFRPGPSIHIGTYYLSRLLDYYDGDLDLVIMAYNAGPGSVDQWTQDPAIKDRDDLLRFAWYGETREYLERVSLDYMIYKELYGDD